jgi:signal transduction histidine kinase
MLRIPFLRNLLLLVLAAVVCLPLYTLLVLDPAYHEQLIHETEDESVRFARYLVSTMRLDGTTMLRENLPPTIGGQVRTLMDDRHLVKLRFFAQDGEIVFSTEAQEVGKANSSDSFRNIVAKGQVYSNVVKKDHKTADGMVTKSDVVETYVPLMVSGRFGGAIEVYYDITSRVAKFEALTMRTMMITGGLSLGLLTAMLLALKRAKTSIDERGRAEEALRQVNEELEKRIDERTVELSEANAHLTSEIAERTLAQMALSKALEDSRQEREKLDGILQSVGDGLVVTDHRLVVQHMNATAEKLLALPLEKALGQPLGQLGVLTNLSDKVRSLLNEECGVSTFNFELPGTDPKTPRVFRVRFSRLVSDQLESGLVLLIHDVTRECELDRLKNAFLGMAAHELNAPLAAILGFSQLLTAADSSAQFTLQQREEYLQLIHNKALELSRLVDDLLDISRIEAGQPLVLNYDTVRLDDLLREVVRPYQEKNQRHRFELHIATAQTKIAADKGRIRQVLNNLISNAVKYSPQGGLIKLSLEKLNETCRFSIADEGIGMTADQVEHVFDRFYRADSSNTAVQGAGLGMSIVRHIILAHQGDIRVESELGRGTTVCVDLPQRTVT